MAANDYQVTFGYKAQDGYYYGPNGKVGKYHRGNDRPTPTGTPINIGNVTIGLTGATGTVSGPHLHTQACTAGYNYADDFDPSPFEFKYGTVVKAGWHSQFGNHVVIRVGGVDITYAHLSKINVAVGQSIGVNNVITKDDAVPLRIAHSEIGGWDVTRTHAGEFDNLFLSAWVGKTWPDFLYQQWLNGSGYRDAKNKQAKAIEDLNKMVNATKAELQTAQAQVAEANKKVEEATLKATEAGIKQAELEAEKAKDQETGNSFLRWLGNLLRKG